MDCMKRLLPLIMLGSIRSVFVFRPHMRTGTLCRALQPCMATSRSRPIDTCTPIRHILLSDVLATHPLVNDLSPSRPIQKWTGMEATSASMPVLNLVLLGPLFALWVHVWKAVYWALHVNMVHVHGIVAATFMTSLLGLVPVLLAAAALMAPLFLPATRSAQKVSKKLMKEQWKTAMHLLPRYIGTSLVGSCVSAGIILLCTPSSSHITTKFGTELCCWSLARAFWAFAIFADIVIWISHVPMHQPNAKHAVVRRLSKWHRRHHGRGGGSINTLMPIKGVDFHPLEQMIMGLSIALGPVLAGAHPVLHFAYWQVSAIAGLVHHTPYTTFDSGIHKLHHQRPGCHFGLFGIMDRCFGTTYERAVY